MNVFMSLSLLPLQMDMYWKSKSGSSSDGLYVVIAIAILVMIMVILNIVKGKMKPTALGGKSSASASARNYSSFALHRLTSNLGFDREQVKMLDYVLRSGGVSDPERFLNSPDLIDRHFKRTYRLIERTSSGEEDLNARLAVLFSTRNIIDINSGGAKATSTRQIPDKTAAVLTVSKINYPVQILSARGDTLIVENPKRSAGSLLQFSNGSKANLAFFTKFSKGFSIETSIVGSSETADGPVLHLAHSTQIKKLSKRRYRRRQTVIATGFYLVFMDDSGKKKKLIADKKRHMGNIIDISAGGCSLKTNTPVNEGQRLKIDFTREDDSIVAALGQVLRHEKAGISTILHVKFLKVPRRSLNSINAMVYEYIDH